MTGKEDTNLGAGGKRLWAAVCEYAELDEMQKVQLMEACRAKDRLDKLDGMLRGDTAEWGQIEFSIGRPSVLVINNALDKANATASSMKQLLAALRLPDAAGKKPSVSHVPRGVHKVGVPSGSAVTALERAMARNAG